MPRGERGRLWNEQARRGGPRDLVRASGGPARRQQTSQSARQDSGRRAGAVCRSSTRCTVRYRGGERENDAVPALVPARRVRDGAGVQNRQGERKSPSVLRLLASDLRVGALRGRVHTPPRADTREPQDAPSATATAAGSARAPVHQLCREFARVRRPRPSSADLLLVLPTCRSFPARRLPQVSPLGGVQASARVVTH